MASPRSPEEAFDRRPRLRDGPGRIRARLATGTLEDDRRRASLAAAARARNDRRHRDLILRAADRVRLDPGVRSAEPTRPGAPDDRRWPELAPAARQPDAAGRAPELRLDRLCPGRRKPPVRDRGRRRRRRPAQPDDPGQAAAPPRARFRSRHGTAESCGRPRRGRRRAARGRPLGPPDRHGGRERDRPDATQLDDPDPLERPAHRGAGSSSRTPGRTCSANVERNRSWSWPGPWTTRWSKPRSV